MMPFARGDMSEQQMLRKLVATRLAIANIFGWLGTAKKGWLVK